MKQIIFLLACVPIAAWGAAPSTSCPSGYITVNNPYITIATSCPSGTTAIGTADSCLVSSPSGSCIMYALVGVSYTDSSGTYEFIDHCVLQ